MLEKPKAAKTPSKVAAAKKILNKKIKVSSHVKFGHDDTSASLDDQAPTLVHTRSIAPIPIDECEDTNEIGGIELESARKTLLVQDKLDRKRERERIRAAHQERRRKNRSSVKKQSSGVATLAEQSEDDESESKPAAKQARWDATDEQLGMERTQAGLDDDEELALHLLMH